MNDQPKNKLSTSHKNVMQLLTQNENVHEATWDERLPTNQKSNRLSLVGK